MKRFVKVTVLAILLVPFFASMTRCLAAEELHGLTLVRPGDPQFPTLLQSQFPDLATAPNFNGILPLSVIVQNNSNATIRAYSVRWFIVPTSGKTISQEKLVMKGHEDHYLLTGQFPALAIGESQLVTPFMVWSSLKNVAHSANSGVPLGLDNYLQSPAVQSARTAKHLYSRLDAVLGSDHILAGNDSLDLLNRYTIDRNAQHDEGLSVLHLLSANVSDAELIAKMQYHVSLALASDNSDGRKMYREARSEEATLLMARYKKYGRSSLLSAANRLVRIPRSKDQKAPPS